MGKHKAKKMLKKEKEQKTLKEEAIEELRKMLRSEDPKIKIRAISLILRHSEKIRDKDDSDLDFDLDFIKDLENLTKTKDET